MCLTTKKHNQTSVTHVLKEMLETVENIPKSCIIQSSNCCLQYISAQHFGNIQNICNKVSVPIIHLLSVTGHGKGEVNHIGGLVKCSTCRYMGTDGNATNCKNFLGTMFAEKTNPKFFLKPMDVDDLADSREEPSWKNTWRLKVRTAFKSWFLNLIPQPSKLSFTYVSVTVDW